MNKDILLCPFLVDWQEGCSASWFIVLGADYIKSPPVPGLSFPPSYTDSTFLSIFAVPNNSVFEPHVHADSLHVLLKVDWSLPQTWLGKIFYAKCYLVVVCHSSTYKIVKVIKLLEKTALKDSEIIFMMIIIYFYNYYIKLFKLDLQDTLYITLHWTKSFLVEGKMLNTKLSVQGEWKIFNLVLSTASTKYICHHKLKRVKRWLF